MSARIINGKEIAAKVRGEVKEAVAAMEAAHGYRPGLATVLVGENTASATYVRSKRRACEEVGIRSIGQELSKDVSQDELKAVVEGLNNDPDVDGILVQLPLPKHIDEEAILATIDLGKDVDGFHPMNVGNLSSGYESSVPCTPLGCYLLIKKVEPNLNGKKAVIVGRSNLNGKPMTQLLLK
ncbi:MAG: tetrahydrofolate dehydrogenase/cyclohydrolase catalytic domain-containing protein, partial [Chloroflexota bacterium]